MTPRFGPFETACLLAIGLTVLWFAGLGAFAVLRGLGHP